MERTVLKMWHLGICHFRLVEHRMIEYKYNIWASAAGLSEQNCVLLMFWHYVDTFTVFCNLHFPELLFLIMPDRSTLCESWLHCHEKCMYMVHLCTNYSVLENKLLAFDGYPVISLSSNVFFLISYLKPYSVVMMFSVSDTELKRLKEAFKRSSSLSGYMAKFAFFREVLGDNVPLRLAEVTSWIIISVVHSCKIFLNACLWVTVLVDWCKTLFNVID